MHRIVVDALAVVLAVALGTGVTACDDGDRTGGDRGPKSEAPRTVKPVYRIKDAETAVPGEDYEVLHEIPGPIGYKAQLLLDDGTLVLLHRSRYSRDTGALLPDLVQLWDPATGRRETIPARWPRGVAAVTATSATDVWVSFTRPGRNGRLGQVVHYDRTSGRSRTYTAPSVPGARRDRRIGPPLAGPDGRIYFLTGSDVCIRVRCRDLEDRELWSFAPGAPQRVRREAGDVDAYAVSRTLVAWVEPQDDFKDFSKRLSVRAHGSRRVHTIEVRECHSAAIIPIVQASGQLVLACGRLFDDRARQVTDFELYSHDLSGVTDRWVAYGWTVLDVRTGRLLQILDDRVWHNRTVVMNRDLILFPGPDGPPNSRGASWTLARLH